MTALSRLRRRLGPPDGSTPRAFFDLETVRGLLDLADACEAAETAVCAGQAEMNPPLYLPAEDDDRCLVGRHLDACPVAIAEVACLRALSNLRDLP